MGHGGAGALLAVAQGGVEDDDAVLLGLRCVVMEMVLLALRSRSRLGALGFLVFGEPPECPGANAQPALRG